MLFRDLSPRVFAYARRHCEASDAQDVVADTFLVAWRRFADVPDDPLPWLLVVARNTILNRHRSRRRHDVAVDAVRRLDQLAAEGADQQVVTRSTMLGALAQLTELEREAVLLVAWDGLGNRAAAEVAGCSTRAFEVRLSRARARLARVVADHPSELPAPSRPTATLSTAERRTDMPTTIDPLTLVGALRPDEQTLDAEWDASAQDAALESVFTTSVGIGARPGPGRARLHSGLRRRWVVAGGVVTAGAAAAVVVGVVLPTGSPGGPSRAEAAIVHRLAIIAGHRGPAVGPTQYAYISVAEEQTPDPGEGPIPGRVRVGNVDRDQFEQWTAPGGAIWVRHTATGTGGCLDAEGPVAGSSADGNYEDLSAAELAVLPTDPHRLAAYLDAHPTGDNRGSRNRFMAVGDLVRTGLASPALRAAALDVLAETDGITVTAAVTDDHGRPAVRVDHAGDHGFTDALFFDPATSSVLEERSTKNGSDWHYAGVVLESSVVDALPAGVPTCPPPTNPAG